MQRMNAPVAISFVRTPTAISAEQLKAAVKHCAGQQYYEQAVVRAMGTPFVIIGRYSIDPHEDLVIAAGTDNHLSTILGAESTCTVVAVANAEYPADHKRAHFNLSSERIRESVVAFAGLLEESIIVVVGERPLH